MLSNAHKANRNFQLCARDAAIVYLRVVYQASADVDLGTDPSVLASVYIMSPRAAHIATGGGRAHCKAGQRKARFIAAQTFVWRVSLCILDNGDKELRECREKQRCGALCRAF